MKKQLLLLAAMAATLSGMGQTSPNRVIVNNTDGSSRSIMTERVENIKFATVNGEVKVDINVIDTDAAAGEITIELSATPECKAWKYAVVPEVSLSNFATDADLAAYVDSHCPYTLRVDVPGGVIETPGLMAGGHYALCAVGIDMYGTVCDVTVAPFKAESVVAGAPAVDMAVGNVGETSFEVTFTPNKDCMRFSYVVYRSGEVESMYEFYGSQMGATSIEDFIANYLSYNSCYETTTETFSGLERARDYDVYVVPFDKEDVMCPMQKKTVTTAGVVEGESVVTVEQDEYKLIGVPNPDNILQTIYLPFQVFLFTPNDATVKWRAEAYTEEELKAIGIEAAKAAVMAEPDPGVPDDMWYRYGKRTMSWQIDPDTKCYVFVAGKNAKGEWGEMTVAEFRTPAQSPSGAPVRLNRPHQKRR